MKMEIDDTGLLSAEWPKDSNTSAFIRRLRLSFQQDIFLAGILYPHDIKSRLKYLLTQFQPISDDYRKLLENSPIPHKPQLTYIDIEEELDIKNLTVDDERYWINWSSRARSMGILEHFTKFHLKKEGKELSPDVYRDQYIDGLTLKTFESKDLLDQILILLVIKGAQSGETKCLEKLMELFGPLATRKAQQFINRWFAQFGLTKELGELGPEQVAAVAQSILMLLLRGDPVKTLIDSTLDKGDVTLQLNRKLPAILLEQFHKVPQQLAVVEINLRRQERAAELRLKKLKRDLAKFPEEKRKKPLLAMTAFFYRFETEPGFNQGFEEICEQNNLGQEEREIAKVLRDWYKDYSFSKHQKGATSDLITTMVNPYFLLAGANPKFNADVYKPNKKASLMLWLFGSPRPVDLSQSGAFQRKLNDWFKTLVRVKRDPKTGKKYYELKPQFYQGGTVSFNDELSELQTEAALVSVKEDRILRPEEVRDFIKQLDASVEAGKLPKRDREIVYLDGLKRNIREAGFGKYTQETIAKKFGLSVRQIKRIVQGFKALK